MRDVAPKSGVSKEGLSVLPLPLAITIKEYQDEENLFVKLHRLADASEIITRFSTIILLKDLLRQYGAFPESLRKALLERIERPTFGGWRSLLEISCNNLPESGGQFICFIEGLPEYVRYDLLPTLGGGEDDPREGIVALRNLLAHQGRLSERQARELLAHHQQKFAALLLKLSFLAYYEVLAKTSDGEVLSLKGLRQNALSYELFTSSSELIKGLEPNHIVLCRGHELLDLYPLQTLAEVFQWRNEKLERLSGVMPQIYFRASKKGYLEFTPFGSEAAFSQQHGPILESFRQIFQLEEWRNSTISIQQRRDFLFDDLILELGEVFVGRETEMLKVKETISATDQGVLWVSGKPGIGKSAFMARLIQNYRNAKQHYLIIPYFFRIGHSGCSTEQFMMTAMAHLQKGMGGTLSLAPTVEERRQQFIDAVRQASELLNKRIVFLVDGLDEIFRLEPAFISLIFAASSPRVTWLCAGRSEPPEIQIALRQSGAVSIFPDGLPSMGSQTIRAMLTTHLERLKYRLFERDEMFEGDYHNRFIEVLVHKSHGLPLYVRMAIDDLCEGKWSLDDEDKLPEGLKAYFERILERLGVSSIGTLLTPLFCLLAWAKEPVTEYALKMLMSRHHLSDDPNWDAVFTDALEHGHLMLRRAPTPEGRQGWTFYHDTFRQHLLESARVSPDRNWSQRAWLYWCGHWSDPLEKSLRLYALRNYPEHLFECERWPELFEVARNRTFYQTQVETCPNQPELPLYSMQIALRAGAVTNNAHVMSEFMLGHSQRLMEITQESPLDALRAGSLIRALEMSDLHDLERAILWHLLLAWELKETHRMEDLKATIERLQKKALPRLLGSHAEIAAKILAHLLDLEDELFQRLIGQLLNDRHIALLCEHLVVLGHLTSAHDIAGNIKEEHSRVAALRKVGLAYLRQGDFRVALAIAEQLTNEDQRAELLQLFFQEMRDAVEAQAKTGNLSNAVLIAQLINSAQYQSSALRTVVLAQVKSGCLEAALRTARQILETGMRDDALNAIARSHIRARAFPLALTTGSLITNHDKNQAIVFEVAQAQTQLGEYDSALRAARKISSKTVRTRLLSIIAQGQKKAGDFYSALESAQYVSDKTVRSSLIYEIALSQAQTGDLSIAIDILRQVASSEVRGQVLCLIAKDQVRSGDVTSAIRLGHLFQQQHFTTVLCAIAVEQTACGESKPAVLDTLVIAQVSARKLESKLRRAESLLQIACTHMQLGYLTEGRSVFTEAVTATSEIMSEKTRMSMLLKIASAQKETGEDHAASNSFSAAFQVALNARGKEALGRQLRTVALAEASQGRLSEAVETSKYIQNAARRAATLVDIADLETKSGDKSRIRLALSAADDAARAIGDKRSRYMMVRQINKRWNSLKSAVVLGPRQNAELQLTSESPINEDIVTSVNIHDHQSSNSSTKDLNSFGREDPNSTNGTDISAILHEIKLTADILHEGLRIHEVTPRSDIFLGIVAAQVQIGDIAAALKSTEYIADEEENSWALLEIASTRIESEDFAGALDIAARIKKLDIRISLLKDVSIAQAEAGHSENASQTIRLALNIVPQIQELEQRATLLQSIAITQATIGESETYRATFEQARAIIGEIEDREVQVRLLLGLGEAFTQVGLGAEASVIFASSANTLEQVQDDSTRNKILQTIALAQIEMKQFGKSFQTIQRIREENDRMDVLMRLASAQAGVGQFPAALRAAELISQKWQRSRVLGAIGVAQAAAGFTQAAEISFAEAVREALDVKEQSLREFSLRYASSALANGKDFEKALSTTQLIDDEMLKIESFGAIAVAQADAGEKAMAVVTFELALEAARQIQSEAQRATALRNIAIAQVQAGLANQATQTAESILIDRGFRLAELATSLVAADNRDAFKRLLVPCAYYPDAASKICGLLARLYPEQANDIATVVLNTN